VVEIVASRYAATWRVRRKIDNILEYIRIFAVEFEGEYVVHEIENEKIK
jgi:hypothetical protein